MIKHLFNDLLILTFNLRFKCALTHLLLFELFEELLPPPFIQLACVGKLEWFGNSGRMQTAVVDVKAGGDAGEVDV